MGSKRAVSRRRALRRHGKARVETLYKRLKDDVGLFERRSPMEAQFEREAILERAPEALDAPLGLW